MDRQWKKEGVGVSKVREGGEGGQAMEEGGCWS